ncbi:MAG TPA: hypothetical protein VL137_14730, partial [Polyangiaceae bacterium]|nr:hypothetical protein [Polyangiaceae bacterium]
GPSTDGGAPDAGMPQVMSSGALATGSFTFTRSRNIPFVDFKDPGVGNYDCTIDVQFDLVATWLHCEMVTGAQQASITTSGTVKDCDNGLLSGH